MKEKMLYKTLVIGVIVLFVGITFQPAVAVDVSKSVSDNEEECNLCPSFEDVVDSEDVEKYKEIYERISTPEDMNMERPICEFLKDASDKWDDLMYLAENEERLFLWIYAYIRFVIVTVLYFWECYEH